MINKSIIEQIGNTSSLLKFLTMKDLQDKDPHSPEMIEARNNALQDPVVKDILIELKSWPGNVLKRHNDAKLLIHKLSFLADLGLTIAVEDLKEVTDRILQKQSSEGVLTLKINIPKQFGGSGEDHFSWMLCDAPLLMYSLLKMGVDRKILNPGLEYLIAIGDDYGYPCTASSELGRFNGPGKRGTLCPYANLLMVKLLSRLPDKQNTPQCRAAVEALLEHMEKKDKRYLFGVGTDFRKLKYPFIWYDILHVTDTLSHFDFAVSDPRFKELLEIIKGKADSGGFYRAESVWMAWKQLDSGQKKEPSLWISFVVLRILKRIEI
ncbi:MAG: hypothetical protein JEY91_02550 [Spirochaetaceae bacterium]|nr:hypothetical protein [Spirochaetaceae bacterium]